jgi:2-polyprenyl-3-methyl-5-hydroxy-6-metoxy-1,4-benzoquinol methylase
MHYWISNNIIIKSENAAKSCNQTNKLVLKYISTLSNNFVALDYGCGKLRYTIPLCKTVKSVYAIDSIDQLSRIQVINGRKTSILSYADSTSNLNVFELSEDHWKNQNYDVVFCCNVLSAIPNQDDRIQVLKNIKSVLKTNREALITVQYRNSYFI